MVGRQHRRGWAQVARGPPARSRCRQRTSNRSGPRALPPRLDRPSTLRAATGRVSQNRATRSTASDGPSSTTSTLPSSRLRAQPPTPAARGPLAGRVAEEDALHASPHHQPPADRLLGHGRHYRAGERESSDPSGPRAMLNGPWMPSFWSSASCSGPRRGVRVRSRPAARARRTARPGARARTRAGAGARRPGARALAGGRAAGDARRRPGAPVGVVQGAQRRGAAVQRWPSWPSWRRRSCGPSRPRPRGTSRSASRRSSSSWRRSRSSSGASTASCCASTRSAASPAAGSSAQLRTLTETGDRLRTETGALVTALRKPNARGQWGQMQLRNVVEAAGMLKHCDFTEQHSFAGDETTLRPDMVVNLPGGKSVVVDAKSPLQGVLDAYRGARRRRARAPPARPRPAAAKARQGAGRQGLLVAAGHDARHGRDVPARRVAARGGPRGRPGAAPGRDGPAGADRHADHAAGAAALGRLRMAAGAGGRVGAGDLRSGARALRPARQALDPAGDARARGSTARCAPTTRRSAPTRPASSRAPGASPITGRWPKGASFPSSSRSRSAPAGRASNGPAELEQLARLRRR